MIEGLLACGCYRSAFDYIARATKAFPNDRVFSVYDDNLTAELRAHYEKEGENVDDVEIDDYPDKGLFAVRITPGTSSNQTATPKSVCSS